MDEGPPARVSGKFNNKIQRANGGPGRAGVMAVDVHSSDQRQDVPGTRSGQPMQELPRLLGQERQEHCIR